MIMRRMTTSAYRKKRDHYEKLLRSSYPTLMEIVAQGLMEYEDGVRGDDKFVGDFLDDLYSTIDDGGYAFVDSENEGLRYIPNHSKFGSVVEVTNAHYKEGYIFIAVDNFNAIINAVINKQPPPKAVPLSGAEPEDRSDYDQSSFIYEWGE